MSRTQYQHLKTNQQRRLETHQWGHSNHDPAPTSRNPLPRTQRRLESEPNTNMSELEPNVKFQRNDHEDMNLAGETCRRSYEIWQQWQQGWAAEAASLL
jgi:hypothetical protein